MFWRPAGSFSTPARRCATGTVAATLPRHPNLIWAQLADDRLTASFIADGHHLPADAFKAMLRAKGLERVVLVSDTAALGGLPPGMYRQPIGSDVELRDDGRLGIAGTPYLAGAARPLIDDIPLAMRMGELGLADALRLATDNPGRLIGGRGRMEVGFSADLIRFAWEPHEDKLHIKDVWLQGQRRH